MLQQQVFPLGTTTMRMRTTVLALAKSRIRIFILVVLLGSIAIIIRSGTTDGLNVVGGPRQQYWATNWFDQHVYDFDHDYNNSCHDGYYVDDQNRCPSNNDGNQHCNTNWFDRRVYDSDHDYSNSRHDGYSFDDRIVVEVTTAATDIATQTSLIDMFMILIITTPTVVVMVITLMVMIVVAVATVAATNIATRTGLIDLTTT